MTIEEIASVIHQVLPLIVPQINNWQTKNGCKLSNIHRAQHTNIEVSKEFSGIT